MLNPVIDVETAALQNNNYRWVWQTSQQMQYVFMSLSVGQDIGEEIHPWTTQFIRIEQGAGIAVINGLEYDLNPSTTVFIPAGTKHNIINNGDIPLKLYTLYSPPMHKPGLIQTTKPEAD